MSVIDPYGVLFDINQSLNQPIMTNPQPITQSLDALRHRHPFLWLNPGLQPVAQAFEKLPFGAPDIEDAEQRLQRFRPLLRDAFPELTATDGIIESPLCATPALGSRIMPANSGHAWVKADHALPVAGSIKARGGIYAVLHHAEHLALEAGLLRDPEDDTRKLLSPEARTLFAQHELSVGSTGNLGLSIGIAGAALGFNVTVHMSVEAKDWKKARLRKRGVTVIEHASDYTAACVVARAEAERNPRNHFIDDENSVELFLGYATAVPRLRDQLAAQGVVIGPERPLFLYLPCGVGGAPGGITFAARQVFGDAVHCFFVEPVEAPCMLLGLLTNRHADVAIYELGLSLKTDADGLAVSTPSRFIGQLMLPLLSGCFTLEDPTLYRFLLDMFETEGMEVEPSAAAGCGGPRMLIESEAGQAYLAQHDLHRALPNALHLIWTTGGLFVPPDQHEAFRAHARSIEPNRSS